MSIHNAVNFENIRLADQEPEWMRTERYDYCEPYSESAVTLKGLVKKLVACFM